MGVDPLVSYARWSKAPLCSTSTRLLIGSNWTSPATSELRSDAVNLLRERLRAAPVSTVAALATFTPIADQYQQDVITCRERTIRLVAPAGSGKTQTMVNRILTRIKEGMNPTKILMLTFDRSAAGSLELALASNVAKIESTIGRQVDVHNVTISTLNAFGLNLLREFVPEEAKSVVSAPANQELMKQALEGLQARSYERFSVLPKTLKRRYYLDFFSYMKNQLIDPRQAQPQDVADLMLSVPQATAFFSDDVLDDATISKIIQAVHWLYRAHERLLSTSQQMDFDDQKLRAYVTLLGNPHVRTTVQGRHREIVVDEFQDINKLDFEFINVISEKSDLVVTGDDDQAIYGFRGCSPDYIIDLPQYLGRAVVSKELSINYRCPPNIVRHADRLIRHNTRRIDKRPIPFQSENSTITVAPTLSASIEAKSITEYIRASRANNRSLEWDQIAVLYRTNAQSLPIQIDFILQDIPYSVREEDNLLANESLTKLLGTLRAVLALQEERTPMSRDQVLTIQSYFRYLTPGQLRDLRDMADRRNLLSLEAPEALYSILPKAEESQFVDVIETLIRFEHLDTILDYIRRRFKGLGAMVGSLEDAIEQRVPLAEILEVARDFDGNTSAFVNTMDEAIARANAVNAGRQEWGVSLLTYFKCKGRQWHTVVLCSCNEGLIPHSRSPIEDERRLFYVALTRASANLLVSYVANAVENKVQPSRFLYESGLLAKDT